MNSLEDIFTRNYKLIGLDRSEIKCDIFSPLTDLKRKPAIVFMHGGGFVGGNKEQFFSAASHLALTKGAICVNVAYRTAKVDSYPAPIIDCISVCNWLYENRKKFNIDPDKICLVGSSSGANIAAMTMLCDERYLEKIKINKNVFRPKNGVFINGIMNLVSFVKNNPQEKNNVAMYLNNKELDRKLLKESSPCNYIKKGLNIRFLHGSKDQIISLNQIKNINYEFQKVGSKSDLIVYENEPHAWFNSQEKIYDVIRRIEQFIDLLK